ncbi:hypothetical protein LOTGIDRAFT_155135 [Lottia gigantea]|uniref:C-type lectin domain-containing protein n=1 Tax=Lottia gigantea TaxID=225164 RepID=V4B9K7_LOTGI|nr:hypothetical protein LOTGIDRAFT_155135 [Lottia gigantea]ESO85644.1 hypothetical protein LOTGIDRAFT_155135 [Lottia gigantea]
MSYPFFKNIGNPFSNTGRGPSECELKGYQVYVNLGICLKINATEVGWDAAYDVCQQDSGYLLNIYTDEIYSALEQFTTDHGVEKVYIGGYGVKSNGFEWSRGGQIKTEYWNAYEPDNHQGTEYCVSYFNGDTIGLYDIVCTEKQPFVCELML